jgi:hypothetical protein
VSQPSAWLVQFPAVWHLWNVLVTRVVLADTLQVAVAPDAVHGPGALVM